MMKDFELDALIARLEAEEERLRFPSFSNDDAIALGQAIVSVARERGLAVTVDIRRYGQQLYHCALSGTCADNDQWALRKGRVAERFGHSSFLVGSRLRKAGLGLEEKYFVSPLEYSAHGGAVPVVVEGTGQVGTVTVSGLPQEEDHALAVECIEAFIGDLRRQERA
jgi:uncharacterized protein (UPF0303 family)